MDRVTHDEVLTMEEAAAILKMKPRQVGDACVLHVLSVLIFGDCCVTEPQDFLYFLSEPHGLSSFLPNFADIRDSFLRRPSAVNLPHDLLSPSHGIRNRSDGRRHTLPAVVLSEFPSRQNRSHRSDDSFATLVHQMYRTTVFRLLFAAQLC